MTHSEIRTDSRNSRLAALNARLQPLRDLPDGTVYTEPSGIHFHVVTKSASSLCFWLVEQTRPSTGVIQSEIDLDDPLSLVEPYTQAMMLSLLWQPQPESVYLAGLGGGRLALVLYHVLPEVVIHATDIEPAIPDIARRYFGLPEDPRVKVTIEDGRVYLQQVSATYDIILVDAFLDNGYSPYRLATREFYELCRARLTSDGVVAINLLAGDEFLHEKVSTISKVFPHVWQFTMDGENTIVFASDAAQTDHHALIERAHILHERLEFAFPFAKNARLLAPTAGVRESAATGPLTDDNAPDGYFAALPSFGNPFSTVAADLPCPCGSGLRYLMCHGRA